MGGPWKGRVAGGKWQVDTMGPCRAERRQGGRGRRGGRWPHHGGERRRGRSLDSTVAPAAVNHAAITTWTRHAMDRGQGGQYHTLQQGKQCRRGYQFLR